MTEQTHSPAAMTDAQIAPLTGRAHDLKTDAYVFEEVVRGRKLFEIRKNDRGFQCGDLLRLRETRLTGAEMAAGEPLIYTGREIIVRVIGILHGPKYGLAEGWCIMSIAAHGIGTGAAPAEVAPQPEPPELRLNGFQLMDALTFIAPDFTDEQLETEAVIQFGPAREDEEGSEPAGMFCWYAEYPEEGSIRLGENAGDASANSREIASVVAEALPVHRRGPAAAPQPEPCGTAGWCMKPECRKCYPKASPIAAPQPEATAAPSKAAPALDRPTDCVEGGFFAYDTETGFNTYDTAAEARDAAEESLSAWRDAAREDGEWPTEAGHVCWGAIQGRAEATPEDAEDCIDYLLAPTSGEFSKAAGAGVVEALRPFAALLNDAAARGLTDSANIDCQVSMRDVRRAHDALAAHEAAQGDAGESLWPHDVTVPGLTMKKGTPLRVVAERYRNLLAENADLKAAQPQPADELRDAEPSNDEIDAAMKSVGIAYGGREFDIRTTVRAVFARRAAMAASKETTRCEGCPHERASQPTREAETAGTILQGQGDTRAGMSNGARGSGDPCPASRAACPSCGGSGEGQKNRGVGEPAVFPCVDCGGSGNGGDAREPEGYEVAGFEPPVVREFTNEIGNRIKITIEGPNSISENTLTPREFAELREALATPPTQQSEAVLPEGWVPLRIAYAPGEDPEDVAFGPPHMMNRLKKWLDKHFASLAPQQSERTAGDERADGKGGAA